MLELSPEELRKKRYADYAMAPDAWDAVTLLHKYFLPAKPSPGLTEEGFYADVGKPEARREIDQQLKAVERSLSP
jgi:hypothetical protein